MEIVNVTIDNLYLLLGFIENNTQISDHFRYYKTRDPHVVLKNHKLTLIGLLDGQPMAYGHIDFEGKYWLGICIHKKYCGFGYGRQMLAALLEFADKDELEIALSVDSDNSRAIDIYVQNGFLTVSEKSSVTYMLRKKQD